MVKPTKAMKSMLAKAPGKNPMPLQQAVEVLKQFSKRKFDQTIEIHINLGIDPAQNDQIVRGSLVLPHGIGKAQRVIVSPRVTWPKRPKRRVPRQSARMI